MPGDFAVLEDGKLDGDFSLLHQRRTRRFGNQVVPIHSDVMYHALQIGSEIHSHRVTENIKWPHSGRGFAARP